MEHPKIDDLGFPPHFRNLHLEWSSTLW
jgi:hypothetical protein